MTCNLDYYDEEEKIGARPRRMSEYNNPGTSIVPIPAGSSFFILSQTNRLFY